MLQQRYKKTKDENQSSMNFSMFTYQANLMVDPKTRTKKFPSGDKAKPHRSMKKQVSINLYTKRTIKKKKLELIHHSM